ncbi:hypothetical protein [Limoniibacter endophyticus]|uniref:Uncharacterized protein n=1 Tax=Limoniibacter endophyticus TaxID=1565040 RepID=A0A8J3GI51_9HYPH|nr:hypothetical protein [Limoniibacter endophyticus]GHC79229.1 hypothetical protein GCM10010136_31620 [Limoniibacter endophyticus]
MARRKPIEAPEAVQKLLDQYEGNHVRAIEDLIAHVEHLEREITFASLAMSYGFSRGWKPDVGAR